MTREELRNPGYAQGHQMHASNTGATTLGGLSGHFLTLLNEVVKYSICIDK